MAMLTLAELAQGLRAAHPPVAHVDLRMERCALRVESNSPPLLETLERYFDGFVAPSAAVDVTVQALEMPEPQLRLPLAPKTPDAGKPRIKEEFCDLPDGRVVRKRLTGMHLLFGGGINLAIGPCLRNYNQVVNFVNNRFIEWKLNRGYHLCHAAGVCRDGRGLAIAGQSGRGKSTLTLHLLSAGLSFVSNDRLMIRADGNRIDAVGVPKLPRINPGTIVSNTHLEKLLTPDERARFERLPPDTLWNLEQKYDVDIQSCFGAGRFALRADLAGVILLTWNRAGGAFTPQPVDLRRRPELLAELMKPVGLHFQASPDQPTPDFSPQGYLETLGGCPVYEFGGGVDFSAATRAAAELLARRRIGVADV